MNYILQNPRGIYLQSAKDNILKLTHGQQKVLNEIKALRTDIKNLQDNLEVAEQKTTELQTDNEKRRKTANILRGAVAAALLSGAALGWVFSSGKSVPNNTITQKSSSPTIFQQRIEAATQTIYEQQLKVTKDWEITHSNNDLLALEKLNKTLLDINKFKFDVLSKAETGGLDTRSIETELIKIEKQIK